ncbi:MAG: hypothetical protein ACKO3W_05610, partial [bacterium]
MDTVLLVVTAAAAVCTAAIVWLRTRPAATAVSPEQQAAEQQLAAQALRDAVAPLAEDVKRTGAAVEQIQRNIELRLEMVRTESADSARKLREELA